MRTITRDRLYALNDIMWFCAISILIIYFAPFVLLGQHAYITIHDMLDGELVAKYLLYQSGQAFSYSSTAIISNVMNGLPRSTYPGPFNVPFLLFYLLPPYGAYIVNHIIVHLVAFIGMYLLLKHHFVSDDGNTCIVILVSLIFSLIPFYSQYGLSVAGQPLLLYAYLNIRNKQISLVDYAIIAMFPFYSNIALVAPFIISALALLLIIDSVTTKRINTPFLLSIMLLALMYSVAECQMIYTAFIHTPFISHRSAFHIEGYHDIASSIKSAVDTLLHTHYSAGALATQAILLSAIIAGSLLAIKRRPHAPFLFVTALIICICLIVGFTDLIVIHFGSAIHLLNSFHIFRAYFLLPALWMILFAVSLQEINDTQVLLLFTGSEKEILGTKLLQVFVIFMLLYQLLNVSYSNDEYKNNVKLLAGRFIAEPTYSQFMAPSLFSHLDKYINKPKSTYRVVCIGFHPSIAQFNGFYTLDGYANIYALKYKNNFRHIIERELDKNAELKDYFDGWGNRCYIFVNELGENFMYGKDSKKSINTLELNTSYLKEMGGLYILSSVTINNYADNNLTFERKYTDDQSWWDIYLYKIK